MIPSSTFGVSALLLPSDGGRPCLRRRAGGTASLPPARCRMSRGAFNRRSTPFCGVDLACFRVSARGVGTAQRVLLQPEVAHHGVRLDLHDLEGTDFAKGAARSGWPRSRTLEGGESLFQGGHPVRNGSQFAPPLDAIEGRENIGDDRHG